MLLTAVVFLEGDSPYESTKDLPVAYQGRFRSLDSAARLCLQDDGHASLPMQSEGRDSSALTQLWTFHFLESVQVEGSATFLEQLKKAGSTLKMLPLKSLPGEWVSLHAFHVNANASVLPARQESDNFTSFSPQDFLLLREAYFELERVVLAGESPSRIALSAQQFTARYQTAYESLAGHPYRHAQGKSLTYPTSLRLTAETLYYRLPLIEIAAGCYALALIFLIASFWHPQAKQLYSQTVIFTLILGFAIHTVVLALRCYILQRPPVSNMFETVIYVPWIAIGIGLVFYAWMRSRLVLAATALAACILLILLKVTHIDARLENVQAVLDSQYWLIIHVLMVVASYGAFVVCGILGHFYLVRNMMRGRSAETLAKLGRAILYSMYIGVGLLIPGTILGGVWAAQSWGRFWDWDPKEAWAFISACVYLLFIHAYTFHRIRDFGLAVGSVAGLMAISFTWYGVNYVLGTGLHSYGFGNGGEALYFLYLALEAAFLATAIYLNGKTTKNLIERNE